MAKIVIVASLAQSLVNFRGDLIKALIAQGHELFAISPEKDFEPILRDFGARYVSVPLRRTGINPIVDFCTCVSMRRVLRQIKPDVVLTYTIKPVIYGSLIARLAGVSNVFSIITGLGYAFTGTSIKQKLLIKLVSFLYRMALKNNRKVFFQNPDDLVTFLDAGIISNPSQTLIINGSGVNIEHFSIAPPILKPLSFLLIARLLWDKGIGEYVAAARLLKEKYPKVNFKIVGPFDSNPRAISKKEVGLWEAERIIEYCGETSDVRPFLANCSVFVLPSYREGTPRTVLEAMAMGRPIITTDAPGCRETVINGFNGFLIPVKEIQVLADAMEQFVLNEELVVTMGKKSRMIAEKKYDVRKVNEVIMEAMGMNRQC